MASWIAHDIGHEANDLGGNGRRIGCRRHGIASKIAALALRRIHAEMAALVAPGAAAIDPRNRKLLLEGAGLALELNACARNMDMPDDVESLSDQQLDAIVNRRPWRSTA